MGFVNIPSEILIAITAFEDVTHEDLLALRLVHRRFADFFAPLMTGSICLPLDSEETARSDANRFINDHQLAPLRTSAHTLKIWIRALPEDRHRLFRVSGRRTGHEPSDMGRNGAITIADPIMEDLLEQLPGLKHIQLRAWCGPGGHDWAKKVFRALGRHLRRLRRCRGDIPELSISMYGIGCEPGVRVGRAIFDAIPAATTALEIYGGSLRYEGLHIILKRCRFLVKLSVYIDGYGPALPCILNRCRPLALRELNVDVERPWREPVTGSNGHPGRFTHAGSECLTSAPHLRSFRVQRPSCTAKGEICRWEILLRAGVWLEDISVARVAAHYEDPYPNTMMRYLNSPNLGQTLRVLDMQGFGQVGFGPDGLVDMRRVATDFWEHALPNISNRLEELTILPFLTEIIRKWSQYSEMSSLKVLHLWSLSYHTLFRTRRVRLPRLRKLKVFAILDQEPVSEVSYVSDETDCETIVEYRYGNNNTESIMARDVMDYLSEFCPKLDKTELNILPGGRLRVLKAKWFCCLSDIEISISTTLDDPDVKTLVATLYKELRSKKHDDGKRFRFGSELTVRVVISGSRLNIVHSSQYFYGSRGWHRHRPADEVVGWQRERTCHRKSLKDSFPGSINDIP